VFWNVWFFLILLMLFVGLLSGGDASVKVTLVAGIVTIGIMANALFSVAVGLSAARERGVFRRYWVTPVPAALPVSAAVCARTVLVFGAAVIQLLVARAVFGVTWSGGAVSVIVLAAIGAAAFAAVGFAVATLASSPHVANTLANLIFIPMMALSGTALPSAMMPETWARVHGVLPATALTDGLFGAFSRGETLQDNSGRLLYLIAWAVVPGAWAVYRWTRRGP
jgi:ABC-2 type transport system permease protein